MPFFTSNDKRGDVQGIALFRYREYVYMFKKLIRHNLYALFPQVINQPNSRYVKLPGATFPDELPSKKLSPKQLHSFTEVSKFLKSHNRKLHSILGDGNCLFRAQSYLLFGSEDHHQQVRRTLVEFTVINRDALSNYCLTSIDEHAAHMKYDTIGELILKFEQLQLIFTFL